MSANPLACSACRNTGPRSWIPTESTVGSGERNNPGVPVTQLLAEIRALGYPGSANLLALFLNQGGAEARQKDLSLRRATRLVLTRPTNLTDRHCERIDHLADACPEITALRSLIGQFATLLAPEQNNPDGLHASMDSACSSDLPHVHSFVRGLNQDLKVVIATLSTPHHNGRTDGANTPTKTIKREMHGRAAFPVLRHRIFLGKLPKVRL